MTVAALAVRAILSAQEATCDVSEVPWGTLVVNPEFHLVHDANYLDLKAPAPGGIPEVLRRMDEAFAPLRIRHRKVFIGDEVLAWRVGPEFVGSGFTANPSIVMAANRPSSLSRSPEVSVRPARDRSTRDDYDAVAGLVHEESLYDHETSNQLLSIHWRRAAQLGTESYVAYLGGEAVGCAALDDVGGVAVVQEVATNPSHRSRGVAATVVLHLFDRARFSGLAPAVLETPVRDSTVAMYEKLGFDRIGTLAGFFRVAK